MSCAIQRTTNMNVWLISARATLKRFVRKELQISNVGLMSDRIRRMNII